MYVIPTETFIYQGQQVDTSIHTQTPYKRQSSQELLLAYPFADSELGSIDMMWNSYKLLQLHKENSNIFKSNF